MTHLIQSRSSYRELYQPNQTYHVNQIDKHILLPNDKDIVLNGDEPKRWILIMESRHEAWLWDPGNSPDDLNKYWYCVEHNNNTMPPFIERTDRKKWNQPFFLTRGHHLDDFFSVPLPCIQFQQQIVKNN